MCYIINRTRTCLVLVTAIFLYQRGQYVVFLIEQIVNFSTTGDANVDVRQCFSLPWLHAKYLKFFLRTTLKKIKTEIESVVNRPRIFFEFVFFSVGKVSTRSMVDGVANLEGICKVDTYIFHLVGTNFFRNILS